MTGPFPGMDPYLEDRRLWANVHHRLISAISDALTAQVAPHFYVSIEERVSMLDPLVAGDADPIVPDLYRTQEPGSGVGVLPATGQATPTTPTIVVPLTPLEVRDRYLEVRAVNGDEVVTTIEVLSPRNKTAGATGLRAFRKKRRALFAAPTHWIEIDLLRGGQRPDEVARQSDYYVLLKRRDAGERLEVWFIDLRDTLPIIPVPLQPPYADVLLDVGAVLDEVYLRGQFARRLDYLQPPPPPALARADLAWVQERVRMWREAHAT